ncbi:hypothetical protein SFRURICE_018523, partial [Spodoptera frugiperda]
YYTIVEVSGQPTAAQRVAGSIPTRRNSLIYKLLFRDWMSCVSAHRPASYASHASYVFRITRQSHVGIADDVVRTMGISGRSCMSFYTRQTKIRCVRCVRCGPVDAYF